jgi:UDP-glucose 4-epimerase
MTSVLVTGGAGFIGSHLCDRLLAEGRAVVAVDDLSAGHIANLVDARGYGSRFTFVNLDVRADGLGALMERHRPDAIVHLAARRGMPGESDPGPEAEVGVMGLLNVLEGAARSAVGRVVLASTADVYGDQRRLPVRERALDGARPVSGSAISGKVALDYLHFYRRHRGIDHVVLIMGPVYGPRQYPADDSGVVASLAGQMLQGHQPVIFGDGTQTRDFLFVDDAVNALSLALDHGSGRALNVGTGVETSVNDLFRLLAESTGYRGSPRYPPGSGGEARRSALDHAAAARELGWKPWTHLEDGLHETVAFLRHESSS